MPQISGSMDLPILCFYFDYTIMAAYLSWLDLLSSNLVVISNLINSELQNQAGIFKKNLSYCKQPLIPYLNELIGKLISGSGSPNGNDMTGMTMAPAVGVSTRSISAGSCPRIGVHHIFHEIRNVFHISTILIEGICNLTPKIT